MNNIMMTVLFHFASKFIKGVIPTEEPKVDVNKLKLARGYLMAIKVFRLMYISFWGSCLSLVFLLTGLVLIHYTILAYAPWDTGVKVAFTVISGGFYILIAVSLFSYTFAEERWLKIFNASKVVSMLTGTARKDGLDT
jgi:hypothetical protein